MIKGKTKILKNLFELIHIYITNLWVLIHESASVFRNILFIPTAAWRQNYYCVKVISFIMKTKELVTSFWGITFSVSMLNWHEPRTYISNMLRELWGREHLCIYPEKHLVNGFFHYTDKILKTTLTLWNSMTHIFLSHMMSQRRICSWFMTIFCTLSL